MKDVANAPEIKRLESMREMQPYNNPTRAMFIGAPGKVGYLRLGFELDAWGKSILRDHERIAPLIVQQELYCDEGMPEMPVVYIISSGGPNVDGDRYEQDIEMRRGSFGHVTTGATSPIPTLCAILQPRCSIAKFSLVDANIAITKCSSTTSCR